MVAILRNWNTPENRLKAAEAQGKSVRVVTGSWLADLAALGKAIMLCWRCQPRWRPSSYGYARRDVGPGFREARGECDGCRATNEMCAMYLPKEMH